MVILPSVRLASVVLQCTHVLLVTRVFAEDGLLTPLCGVSFFSLSFSTGEPRPVWEAWMDVLSVQVLSLVAMVRVGGGGAWRTWLGK